MTRTELIKKLRIIAGMISLGERIQWGSETELMCQAADMLDIDGQTDEMILSAARESAARAIAERDKLREAARLALEALIDYQHTGVLFPHVGALIKSLSQAFGQAREVEPYA